MRERKPLTSTLSHRERGSCFASPSGKGREGASPSRMKGPEV
jgi:hypothetical protein